VKRIQPVRSESKQGYPSVTEAGTNRRGFLRVVVASGAAVVGSAVLGGDSAHARGAVARPAYRVAIDLTPPITYRGCSSAIVRIVARCYDHKLHGFLQNKRERSGVMAAIRGALLSKNCADLNGSGRYRVGRSVAAALQKRYLKRTGQPAQHCSVSLVVNPKK